MAMKLITFLHWKFLLYWTDAMLDISLIDDYVFVQM